MNATIRIGSPSIGDVPTMVRWGKSARELWVREDGDWYSKKGLREWIKNPGNDVLLVARHSTQLIGMCLLSVLHEWAYCSALYVEPTYRKQGIGKKLIAEAQRRVKQKGIRLFALLVEEENVGAQAFYQRLGYRSGFRFLWMDKQLNFRPKRRER